MSTTAEFDGYRGRGSARQPLAAPAAGSVLLHAGLAGVLVFYGILGGFFKHGLWGAPGTGGAIQVTLVSGALPLPADLPTNENVLTTEKPSQAPAAPSPKDKQMVDESAIAISGKQVKPQDETTPKTEPHQPTPKTNDQAQFGEQAGSQMARATTAQATPTNGRYPSATAISAAASGGTPMASSATLLRTGILAKWIRAPPRALWRKLFPHQPAGQPIQLQNQQEQRQLYARSIVPSSHPKS